MMDCAGELPMFKIEADNGAVAGGGGEFSCAAVYPSPKQSMQLGRQNLHLFRFKNTRFDIIGGAFYFLMVVCTCLILMFICCCLQSAFVLSDMHPESGSSSTAVNSRTGLMHRAAYLAPNVPACSTTSQHGLLDCISQPCCGR